MATPSLQIGSGNWAVKSDSLLGYALPQGKYVPRDMTFTRATTGTRVNAAGLVEVVPYNLLTYSQDYTNASWLKSGITISANVITSPNGSVNASKLVENGALVEYGTYKGITNGFIYSHSIYAKKAERDWIKVNPIAGANKSVWFNLANGTIGTNNSGAPATIESVGNGWYRCIVNGANHLSGASFFSVMPCTNNNVETYTGTSGSGIYIWGAQLVEGTQPLTYLPTTTRLNIPRIDYSTGSANLLLEPQRTNLVLYSEDFSNVYWQKGGSTVTANSTTAPNGIFNADSLIEDTSTGFHQIYNSISAVSNTTYTVSVFVKPVNRNQISLTFSGGNFGGNRTAFFGLTGNGTIDNTQSNVTSASIENTGNGWYRCSVTINIGAGTGTAFFQLMPTVGLSQSYTGTGTTSVYVWGAQLEVGTYSTSYIPTTSASVTRNADACTKTGISSLIGQTEGTIFLDLDNIPYNSDWLTLNPISGSPYTNGVGIGYYAGAIRFQIYSPSGTAFGTLTGTSGNNKIALAYKSGDTAIYINGINVFSSSNAFSFNVLLDSITVASQSWLAGSIAANKIYSHSLYTTRLTNSELAQLTTL
jgi:hypothetical protein